MFARASIRSILIPLFAASLCLAQEPPTPPKKGDAEGDRARMNRGQRDRGERRRGVASMIDPSRHLDQLVEEAKLDTTQKEQVSRLFEAHREKVAGVRTAFRPTEEESKTQRELSEQMREAVRAGDEARISELRARSVEHREARLKRLEPFRKQLDEANTQLHSDIVKVLRADQKASFETFWTRLQQRGGRQGPVRSATALKNLVDDLPDLSREQKDQIDKIFAAYRDDERKLRREQRAGGRGSARSATGAAGGAESTDDGAAGARGGRQRGNSRTEFMSQLETRTAKLHEDVLAVLNEKQRAKVEEQLQGRRGRQRDDRAARDARGNEDAAERPSPDRD